MLRMLLHFVDICFALLCFACYLLRVICASHVILQLQQLITPKGQITINNSKAK